MGLRVYYRQEQKFVPPPGFEEVGPEEYRVHRVLHAIPEGGEELKSVC